MKVRPIGKLLIGDGRQVGYFHHDRRSIIVLDVDWADFIRLAYPGFVLVFQTGKRISREPRQS